MASRSPRSDPVSGTSPGFRSELIASTTSSALPDQRR